MRLLDKVRSKVKTYFSNINSRKGFIVMMVAALVPVVMLSLYLIIKNQGRSEQRVAFEQAVKRAALETARKYIQGLTFSRQQKYLDRICAVSFDNSIKATIGIKQNLIPLTITTIGYTRSTHNYFDNSTYKDHDNADFWHYPTNRYSVLSSTSYFPTTGDVDPDADTTIDVTNTGSYGYIYKRSSSGSYEQRKIYYKSTEASDNTITVTRVDDDKVTVSANVVVDNRNYAASFTATAPKLNADIVIGLPVNTGSMSTNNDPYGTAAWNSSYKSTPLWQIKTECREFVKKILSCRNCAVGLVPYWGNVVLSGTRYSALTVLHGTYKYSDYAAVNPTIPIAEGYKFSQGGFGAELKEGGDASDGVYLTRIMYRSDLDSYLKTYMSNGTTNQSAIENLIYGEVTSSTKFMRSPIDLSYAGLANIFAGYSRIHIPVYPMPYPIYGLTQNPLDVYRYFSIIAPYNDNFKRSSFAYLPIMFGMSMLNNGFEKSSSYTSGTGRKKALILICNQADLWFPREVTYFGFVNDASYIPMIDGDRIDYEKGTLESAGGGYYRSKIYRSSDVVYDTGNYGGNIYPGIFFNEYDEKVAIKCTYPPKGNDDDPEDDGTSKMFVYTTTSQTTATVTRVSPYIGDSSTPTYSNNIYACNVPTSATSYTVGYQIDFSKSDTSSVIAKLKLQRCDATIIEGFTDKVELTREGNYVYICRKGDAYLGNWLVVKLKYTSDSGSSASSSSSSGSGESPTTGTYSLVLPKPGNTKIVVQATGGNGKTAQMLVYKTNPHTTISLSNVTYYSGSGGEAPTSANNIWTCNVPTTATSSSPVCYKITYTKTDTTSPVIAKLELKGCEVITKSADVDNLPDNSHDLVFRQDENYVYVCENNTASISSGSTVSVYVKIRYISSSSDMRQHTTLGYVNKNLTWQENVACSDINGKTTYSGKAYNATMKVYSIDKISYMRWRKDFPYSSDRRYGVTQAPYRFIYCRHRSSDNTVYNDSYASVDESYRGLITTNTTEAKFPTDSSLPSNDYFKDTTCTTYSLSSSGVKEIYAEWLGGSGSTEKLPSCISSSSGSTTTIYVYRDSDDSYYYYPSSDGAKVSSWTQCLYGGSSDPSGVQVVDGGYNRKSSTNISGVTCTYDNYKWTITVPSDIRWITLKLKYLDKNWIPIKSRVDSGGWRMEDTGNGDYGWSSSNEYYAHFAWVRADDTSYFVTKRLENESYGYVMLYSPSVASNSNSGCCWRLAYINQHLIGESTSGYSYSSCTLNSNLDTTCYWAYGAGVKTYTKVENYSSGSVYRGDITFNSTTSPIDFRIYCSYKYYPGPEYSSNYALYHFMITTGSVPSGYSQSTSYATFDSSSYVILTTTKTRAYKAAVEAKSSISFSGNYTKTYSLSTANYYYTIYIPRGKFSGSLGTNDSATINFTLNGAKVIYIEWSNHLDGSEGCYSRKDSVELLKSDSQYGSGYYTANYKPLTRSKNARVKWFVPTSEAYTGHTTLAPNTEPYGWRVPAENDANDDNHSYMANITSGYQRSRQYTTIEKQTSGTYDYPYYDGDVSFLVTNPRRVQNIFAWLHNMDIGTHSYEYNYINSVGRLCTLNDRYTSYNSKKGTETIYFVFNSSNNNGSYISDYISRLEGVEATINVNRVLMAAGYQTCSASDTGSSMASSGSTYLMRNTVTKKMVTAFNNKFGSNGRIYVIHYRYTPGSYSGWSANLGGVYKNYTVSTQADLKAKLHEILQDIKSWSGYEDAKIVD